MQNFTLILALLCISCIASVQGEIYKWQDADGRVHFSDQAPGSIARQSVEEIKLGPINSYERVEISVVEASFSSQSRTVVMYSTERCGYCKKARAWFRANNIAFKEYDIEKSKSARRAFERLNGTGVPIILVGNKRMNGFSAARFAKLYES